MAEYHQDLRHTMELLQDTREECERLRQGGARGQGGLGARGGGGGGGAFSLDFQGADLDGDGSVSRREWRTWADEKRSLLERGNHDREALLQENADPFEEDL